MDRTKSTYRDPIARSSQSRLHGDDSLLSQHWIYRWIEVRGHGDSCKGGCELEYGICYLLDLALHK